MRDLPYWFPVVCDAEYFARLRSDYPEKAHMSDEELHEYYNDGLKYQNLWDHVGDAYSDYEPLADAFLDLLAALKALHERYVMAIGNEGPEAMAARLAIAKAEGKS